MFGIFMVHFSDLRYPAGLLRRRASRNDRLLVEGAAAVWRLLAWEPARGRYDGGVVNVAGLESPASGLLSTAT